MEQSRASYTQRRQEGERAMRGKGKKASRKEVRAEWEGHVKDAERKIRQY